MNWPLWREQRDEQLIKQLKRILQTYQIAASDDHRSRNSCASKAVDPPAAKLLLGKDEALSAVVAEIRAQTAVRNRNNLTRTNAYFAYYEKFPEVHWALLAHLVSRNGGWNMTDLRGSLLRPLLSERTARALFAMFERSNWLIFHDAYPQLLLYAHSVRAQKPLFHLLPLFGVSRFAIPVWQHFWHKRDSALLTAALIVNEQQYIEQRVIRHPQYRPVLQSVMFKLFTACDLNQIVLSLGEDEPTATPLVGRTMHNFTNVAHRIKTGRMLYQTLFHPALYPHIYAWASRYAHTGSRADYFPHRYTPSPHQRTSAPRNKPKIVSPRLTDTWADVTHRPAEAGDWYEGPRSLSVLVKTPQPSPKIKTYLISDAYDRSYRRLRVAASLAQVIRRIARTWRK